MHSTACGVGAASAANSVNSATTASVQSTDGLKMVHNNDDAMNKIPLKSATGLDDEEKNGVEFVHDTETAEEARREQMRANILKWMKKLTIVLICFIGLALITYVIISLCFSEWPKSTNSTSTIPTTSNYSLLSDDNNNATNTNYSTSDDDNINATVAASVGLNESTATAATLTSPNPHSSSASSVITKVAPTIASGVMATTTTTAVATLQDMPPITDGKFESKLGVYEKAAVCSDKQVCSQIGSNILSQNGSAVDSAIATLLCNGILTMHSMGIGGGMLMNVFIKESKRAYSIDAREVAPFAADPDMFENDSSLAQNGGLSIGVPGELMGYYRAHERFGKLPWKALVEPSIKLCHEGFFLNPHQWASLRVRWEHMKNNTMLAHVFVNATTGKLHPIGTKLKPQKELCDTYMLLAENGPLDFYNGTLSKLVVDDLSDLGSTVTGYDLEAYAADLVSSITTQLGDDILYSMPPVSSGAVVAHILSILEGYNLTKADMEGVENQARTLHRYTEAFKFGFAKRWELGDLRFNDVRELVSKLTSPEFAASVRAKINDSTVLNDIYDYGAEYVGNDDYGTSHTVVLAPNGDAVSVTSTINHYFGASQAGKRTGIIFNSVMDDFSIPGKSNYFGFPPAPSNYVEARKRPMSSMSPMILADQDGNVRMLLGSAGGSKIISGLAQVTARVLWFGQDIKEAIDAPRIHHQLVPKVLQYENGKFSEEVLKNLRAKGHKLESFSDNGSVTCGIVRNATAIYANADYRKRGGTAGF